MFDNTPKDELNSILGSSSTNKQSEEPFIMNQSHSKYDAGFVPYDNVDPNTSYNALANYRGEQQGRFAKLGAGLVNTVSGTALDIIGDVGYLLDTDNITDFQKSSEEGFNNWLSDWTNKTKESLKLPIYRTEESKGFSPLSAGWWGDNMPSIASTVSMMIPAELGVGLLSKAGELLGGEKLIKGVEGITGVTGLADKAKGVTGAVLSRHMESLMEGGQTYQDTYQKALQATNDPEKAKEIAGKAAAENYKLNWAAIVQDLPEYMLLHKTFKESGKAFSLHGAKEAAKIGLIEGSEEAYQFVTDKESQRQALLDGKVLKDDNTSFGDRMLEYGKDGDFWTSAFLGALGGAGFGLYGVHKDNKEQKSFDGLLEQHKAVLTGDPTAYKRGENSILNNAIVDNIANGTLDKFQSGLNTILSNPERIKDEDRVEIQKNVKSALEHIEYAKNTASTIINDSSIPNELKKTVFATQLEQKSSEDRLTDINNQLNVLRGKQIVATQITPDLLAYKEAKLTLDGIAKIPNLQGVHKELTKQVNITAKDLLEAYPAFKSVEALDEFVIGSNDSEFTKLLANKEQENLIIKGAKEILYKSKTEAGKAELLKKQEQAKKKAEKEAKTAEEATLAKQKTATPETSNDLQDEIDANNTAEFDETDVTSQPETVSTGSNELYPNTKTGDALNNVERDRISAEHIASGKEFPLMNSNEVQTLIDKHGSVINHGIRFRVSENNGVKSIAIVFGNKTLGYSNTKNTPEVQQLFQQAIKLLETSKELTNAQVKALGFKLIIDNGYINNTTTNPLHLNELNSLVQTNGEYVIFDRGSRKHISENREPFLITEAIEPGKEGSILPNAIRQLGRYIMSFKDSSGNWKYIPLSPAKLANVDKYLNSLRELSAKIIKGDEKGKLTSAQIGELQGQIQDTFISLPKSTFKNGVFDVEIFIADDGNLVVNKIEPSGVKGVKDKVTKIAGIKALELPALTSNGALISYINELIKAKGEPVVLTEDSFRESVPTGVFLNKTQSDKLFQAYVTPEVIHKQDVKIELNKPVVESKTLANETDEEDFSDVVASDDPLGTKKEELIDEGIFTFDKINIGNSFKVKYNWAKDYEELTLFAKSKDGRAVLIGQTKDTATWKNIKDFRGDRLEYATTKPTVLAEEKPLDRRAQNAAKNKNVKLTGDNTPLALKLSNEEVDKLIDSHELSETERITPSDISIETRNDLRELIGNVPASKTPWGFFRNQVIYLWNQAGSGTGYHEAFHAIFRMGINNKDVDRYLKLAEKEVLAKYKNQTSLYKALDELRASHMSYANLSEQQIYELLLEEHMADRFAEWKLSPENSKAPTGLKQLFKRILNMIKHLFKINDNLELFFDKINRGTFSKTKSVPNRILGVTDVAFKNLNASTNTFMSSSRSKQIINTFAALVRQKYVESKHSLGKSERDVLEDLIKERVDLLYDNGYSYAEGLEDKVKSEKLIQKIDEELFLLENLQAKEILSEQVINKLKLFTNKQEEKDDYEEVKDGDDNTTERHGSQESWTISLEDSTGNVIKEYISFATYKTIDELTGKPIILSVDAQVIYNGLGHALSNTDESQIVNKFITYALDNPQAKAVLDMIIADTELGVDYEKGELIGDAKKNLNDLRRIIVAFKNSKVDFYTTTFVPTYTNGVLTSNIVKVFNANLNRAEKLTMKNWASNLFSLRENKKIKDFSPYITKINSLFKNKGFEGTYTKEELNKRIAELQTQFNEIGMPLSSGYLRYSILMYHNSKGLPLTEGQLNYISNWSDIVTPLDIDIIGGPGEYTLGGQLASGKDPYDRGEANDSIGSKLEKFAVGNSYFDESIGSSNFKGSDDNTRYDIIKGSYVLDESRKLRNKQYRDELVKKYPILKDNALLNDEKFLNNLTVNLIDGVRDISFSTNEGKVFGDFTEREYLMQHLGYWFAQTKEGVHTLFRQNEASNTAYDTVMPVNLYVDENGKPNDSAINKVYDNFKAEFDRIKREYGNGFGTGNIVGYNNTEDGRAFRFTEFSNLVFLLGPAKYFQIEGIARNAEQELTPELISEVKKAIKTSLETQIKQFKEILSTNKIINYEGGEITENRTIPNTINGKQLDYKQLSNSLSDFYLNDYINSFALNQLFDGDYALSRDDKGLIDVKLDKDGKFDENGTTYRLPKQALVIDITKRNKGAMGSGTDMGTGNHTVAFIKDINVFVNGSKDGQLIRDSKGNKINSNDAQSYTNINHIMFMARRLGRESSSVKAILRKIRRGIAINSGEQEILEHAQASLNPWKTVTFGREFYIKTSEAVLTRGMVSNITDQKAFDDIMDSMEAMEDTRELTREEYQQFNKELVKLFAPVRGMEYYHRILNQMDIHGIDQVVAQSASKGMTISPQDSLSEDLDLSKSKIEIPNSYKRLQVETPTGKATITAGTQLMQLIDSEQVDSTVYNLNGKDTTLGQIRKEYRQLMASTRNNSFKMAEAYLKEYKAGNINIETLGKKFIKTLQATGADEQLLEIFKLNWNLLPAIDKAEQLFLAHFGSGIMSQKVPGTKVSLMSDAHWNLVVDENNNPVLNKLVKANPEKYKEYKTRKLLHNVRDPKTGKLYSECVLSERVFSKFGLKIGDEIPLELAEMLGVRIPTQDKHSMIALRVVDVLPNYLEGTGIFPSEVVLLSGADFDIDSMFIQQPAFWMKKEKGKQDVPVKFGTETTKQDKWDAFYSYISKDKLFKAELANRREDNPDYHSIIKIHPKGVKDSEGNVIVKGRTEEEKAKLSAAITKTEEETLRFFGLPTNADELEGKEINNNSLNNQILERQIALLTNKAMEDIALTPVDVEPMRDVADVIAKLKGTTNEIQNSSSSLLGKIKANFQNSAGKEGIGPVANALQGFTFLAKNKISRTGEPIKINGKELNEFKYLNSIGGRIADTLSTILSVMTDNAKDPIAGKIGLSLELLSPYNYLISLGVSLEDASLIINTPSIQMYSQLLKEGKYKLRSESERNGSRNEKLVELFKKIKGIEGDSKYDINRDLEQYANSTIETTLLENGTQNDVTYLIEKGLTPETREDNIRILVKFLQIEEEARYFQELNNLIKLTKGLPTSFLEAEKVKKSIAKLGLTKMFGLPINLEEGMLPPPFDLSEAIKNDDLLFNNVKNALTVLDHSSKIFISESAPFQREFRKLLLNLKSNLKEEQVKELKRSLLGFISTRAYIKYMNTKIADFNPAKPELLYPQLKAKTFGSMMSDLKNSKDDNIRNNAFVKWLKIELGVKTGKGATADEQLEAQFDPTVAARVDRKESKRIAFDRVSGKSWIKLSEESINDIVNSFDDLRRNPKTTDVANAAFFYLLSKDNFEYRNDSFIKYISPMMFTNVSEGINTELNQLTKDIIGDDFAKWVDDFRINIASQFATQKYVTRMDDTRLGVNSFNKGEGLKNTNNAVYFDKGKMYFDAFGHAAFMRKLGFEKKVITFEIKNEPVSEKANKDKSVDEILDEIKLFDSQDLEEAKEFIDTVFGLVSTKEEANKLYKKLAFKYHPDKNTGENSTEIFKYLNNTNEKFSDKAKVGGGSFEDYIKSLNLETFGRKKGWKFPEFMVVKIGYETKLFYTPLLTGDEHVDLNAEYTEIPSFGYDTISVLPNTYEDNIETYTKLGQLKGQSKEKTQSETQQKANALISGVEEDVEAFDNEYGDVGFDNSLDSDNPLGVKSETSVKTNSSSIVKTSWTKDSPKESPTTAYIFTENINSIGSSRVGGGSAVIRNNPNAIGIITKKYYVYSEDRATSKVTGGWNQDFQNTEADFDLFKKVNLEQFAKIDKYETKIFPQGFASDLAKIPTKFAEWLQSELLNRYGLITELNPNKTGLISKGIQTKTENPLGVKTEEIYNQLPTKEKIQELEDKLNKTLFEKAVESNKYEVDLENKEDEFRKLKVSDFENVKNKTLGLYDKSGELNINDLFESEFNKITKKDLQSYIDVYNINSLLTDFYKEENISDFENLKLQKEKLEEFLPELKNYQKEKPKLSNSYKKQLYNNAKIDRITDLSRFSGGSGAAAGFVLESIDNKRLGYAMIDPGYNIRYIEINPEFEGFGLATKFINEIRKASKVTEFGISLINNPQMFKVGEKLGGTKLSETKIKLPSFNNKPIELEYKEKSTNPLAEFDGLGGVEGTMFDEEGNYIASKSQKSINKIDRENIDLTKKEIGIKNPGFSYSDLAKNLILKRISQFNTIHGTKHSAKVTKIGQSNSYNIEFKFNPQFGLDFSQTTSNELFNKKTEARSVAVLNQMALKGSKLAKHLMKFASINNVKIVLDDVTSYPMKDGHVVSESESDGSTANGYYDHKTNTIHIAANNSFEGTTINKVILHEIIHSISAYILKNKNNATVQDFIKTFEYAKELLKGDENYALTNVDEFIVGLFQNKDLINKLKEMESLKGVKKYKNLFQEFFDYIMKLLGLNKSDSLYEQAYSIATNVFEEQKNQSEEEKARQDYENGLGDETPLASKSYKVNKGMPFTDESLDRMNVGEKRITIRPYLYKDDLYNYGNSSFRLTNRYGKKVNVSEIKDKEALLKSFAGEKGLDRTNPQFKHIVDWFDGKGEMYVYQIQKVADNIKNEAKQKKQERIPFQTQYVYFKRQINRLERDLNRLSPNTDEFRYKENELNAAKERLANAVNTLDREEFTKMGREQLQWVQDLIDSLPLNPDKRIVDNISTAFEILNTFKDWIGLKDDSAKLREKLFTYIANHNLASINKAFASQGVNITNELLEENMLKDIRWSAKNWGSLSDSINYIVATIGRIISEAQNKAATANHHLKLAIQKEVDTLKEYASKNNTSLSDIYEMMTQTVVREYNGKTTQMLVLTQQYLDGETNPNWVKIQNTPELKHFYDFYQSVLKAAESRLPYSVGKYYVLNKEKTDWKKDLKSSLPSVDNVLFDSFVSNEELLTDAIPDKYRYNIDPSKKSKDLGSGLLEFASYANNHAELNKALPETRLLQEQLKYQQNSDGTVTEREFIDNANPKKSVVGEKSNANQMVETVIDMQLKGKMKDNKTKGIITGKIRDEEGNIIGNKEVHIEDFIDFGLRWNSLLRIGLSPITAITNVIFGDVSNILEAVGGRYFTIGNLHSATKIFSKQIDYINRDRTSNLYKWLDKLNPLQELADYNLTESVQANRKKITKERVLELMYAPQAKGELYLQSRTMIAMLIKEGYMKADGTNTKLGQDIIDGKNDAKANELTAKIQRVNQLVHGRYTQREAAALSQSVWFRMGMQFRKWIPAAIEGRFGDARFDTRLGIDVEGRYKSAWRNTFHSGSIGNTFENMFLPLIASKRLIESGQMTETEVYNMRKNITEAILLFGSLLLIAGLKSGDDDERRRKLRNPWVKAGLTGLNRLSGDLNFFYNPTNIKNMASNAVPMSKLIGDLINIGYTLPHAFYLGDYEVKRGSLKGTNDFYSKNIWKVLPGGAPGGQVQRILNSKDILPELN